MMPKEQSGLARYEGPFQAEREATLAEAPPLIEPLRSADAISASERLEAIVCLLSASDGWRHACSLAGGAFADERSGETRLKDSKGE